MTLEGLEVGMRLETRRAMRQRYGKGEPAPARTDCLDCRTRPCDCTYTCPVCGATRVGAPNHPGGKCPEDLA